MVKLLTLFPLLMFAQSTPNIHVDFFSVSPDSARTALILSHAIVLPSTIRVMVDSTTTTSFRYLPSSNAVVIDSLVFHHAVQIAISYSTLPLTLRPSYRLRSIVFQNDSLNRTHKNVVITESEPLLSNIFGPELSKSGSMSRGFFIGSNRDFTVSSGFRLQLAGKLSDDIDIIAALTDENTPIQPQGNTQTLQEIDNVFVEITSPTYTATVGDFQYNVTSGDFFTVNRKLQGARLIGNYQTLTPPTEISIMGATARGKFHSNQFHGIEGSQGPYRLTGKNFERNIIIIAGSEKVYVDGEQMLRGDNNDYSIDYGSGEIVFSTRRLITGASRIVVDFEYSDRQFTRNAAGITTSTTINNSLLLKANYFREGDDPDAPIDILLTETDKELLRHAGNTVVTKTGVSYAGADSLGMGKGYYAAVDTVIDGSTVRVYHYNAGTPLSLFNVSFSNVGPGNGEYLREGLGRYRFVGKNAGSYAPVIILPVPQLQQNYSFQTVYSINTNLTIAGEYAASNRDRNRFSTLDEDQNSGQAYQVSLRYSPKEMTVVGMNLGGAEILAMERFRDARYSTLDRVEEIEFGRKWGTDSIYSAQQSSERIREATLTYRPLRDIDLQTGYGTMQKGLLYSSSRYNAGLAINAKNIPQISYSTEFINGTESSSRIANNWFRQKGSLQYGMEGVTPSMYVEQEKRSVHLEGSDSLLSSSYAFVAYAPKVRLSLWSAVEAGSEFEWRKDEAPVGNSLQPQSNAVTQTYTFTLKEVRNFSFHSLVTLREKKYEPAFRSVFQNQQTTLIKLQSRYRPLAEAIDMDLLYDVATQRTASLERMFFKVRKGEGQYSWQDANKNGVVDVTDEAEFRLDRYDGEYVAVTLTSDVLMPVVNLKSSARLRVSPKRFIPAPHSFFERLLCVLSTETYFRLEERSTESDLSKIYFLDRRALLNPATTLYGFQFLQQDLFLFENSIERSFRFRFTQRRGMSQYASGLEQNYSRERSLRTRFHVSNDMANQTDVVFKNDNALSSSLLNQSRQIGSIMVSTDLSYRPMVNVEIGFKLETSQSEDKISTVPVIADFNSQGVRFVYGFEGNGQIRTELSREEILLSRITDTYFVPYELTGGRETGIQYLWSVISDYRIGGNVLFSLQYSGRTTNRSFIVHNGKMEVRAFF